MNTERKLWLDAIVENSLVKRSSIKSTIYNYYYYFKDLASIEAAMVVAVYNYATNHHNSRNQITFLLTQILKHKYNTYYMVYYIVYSKENANS